MYLISAEGYKDAGVDVLRIKKTLETLKFGKKKRCTRWFRYSKHF